MVCEKLLFQFVEMSKEIFKDNLVGIYLHGSAAMGCFNPQKSDVDLILVVRNDIPNDIKMEFMRHVVRLNEEAPAKGIELSIVKREVCDPFVYPTPFELHFSIGHLDWFREKPKDYIEKKKGTDKDLAAHFTIIRNFGKVLYGEEIEEVFGEVPAQDYMDSLWGDVENASIDILRDPIYVTLNLCRVLGYLQENSVLSKKAGGEWGMRTLPQKYHALLREALQSYETDRCMKIIVEEAVDFADYMISKIKQYQMKWKSE